LKRTFASPSRIIENKNPLIENAKIN